MKKRLFGLSITAFLLCVLFLFSSCQLSEVLGKGDTTVATTVAETTAPLVTEPLVEAVPEYDFSNITDYSTVVTLGKFIGREISYADINVSEAEYTKKVDGLLISNKYYDEIKDVNTKENDMVDISFKGYIDGVLFQGGTADNQQLTLNDTSGYIAGFAEGLIDKEIGVVVKLNLKFPSDYHSAEHAGKDVVFDVTINFIYQAKELTDEMIVAIMDDYEGITTVEKFHEFFRAAANEEKRSTAISAAWAEIMTESVIIDQTVHTQQSAYYYSLMYNFYKQTATNYDMSLDDVLGYYGIVGEAGLMEAAKDYSKFDIVFNAITYTQNLSITDSEYATLLPEYAEEMNTTVEGMTETYSEDDLKSFLLLIVGGLSY